MESQLVILLLEIMMLLMTRVILIKHDHAEDAEADLDKNVQRSVFRIPGVLHLSLPATDNQPDVGD